MKQGEKLDVAKTTNMETLETVEKTNDELTVTVKRRSA